MPDQKQGGRAIRLKSAVLLMLLTLASAFIGAAAVGRCGSKEDAAPAPIETEKTERISKELQYEVAIHEAGHAVIGQVLMPDRPILRLWLYTEKQEKTDYLGMTEPGDSKAVLPPGVRERSTALFFLGGQASEQILLGNKPPDSYEDKDVANEELLDYCEKVNCECPPASKIGGQCLLVNMMREERERLFVEAMRCLEPNKETVVALANLLFRKDDAPVQPADISSRGVGRRRTLDASELAAFFKAHPPMPCPK